MMWKEEDGNQMGEGPVAIRAREDDCRISAWGNERSLRHQQIGQGPSVLCLDQSVRTPVSDFFLLPSDPGGHPCFSHLSQNLDTTARLKKNDNSRYLCFVVSPFAVREIET